MRTRFQHILLATGGIALGAAPGFGQSVQPIPSSGAEQADAARSLSQTTTYKIDLKLVQNIAGRVDFVEGDRITDYQTTSLTAGLETTLIDGARPGESWTLELDGGGKYDADLDNDSSEDVVSGIFGNAILNWKRGFRNVSPFASYGYETGFKDVFSDHDYTDHKLSGGLRYFLVNRPKCLPSESRESSAGCSGPVRVGISAVASLERTFSNNNGRERLTPRLAAELKGVLFGRLDWAATAAGERRIYDRAGDESRRRDWRALGFLGVDLARVVDPARPIVRELKLGVRWTEAWSNKPNKSYSGWSLIPILTLGRRF